MVLEQQHRLDISMHRLCGMGGLPYPTVMRWCRRAERGLPPVGKRGPRKVHIPDMESVRADVEQLRLRPKRTLGIRAVYEQHKNSVSRREVDSVVQEVRRVRREQEKSEHQRLEWHQPGVAWSLDPVLVHGPRRTKLPVLQMRDLAARYKFPLLSNERLLGEQIATYLVDAFREYGAPLVLKRDNGSNLNHKAVNAVLREYGVVPLNSPPYYPQYNGGIEHDQAELKQAVRDVFLGRSEVPDEHVGPYLQAAVHDLNHRPRHVLHDQTACQVFFRDKDKVCFTMRQREEIHRWICQFTRRILADAGDTDRPRFEAVWRFAVSDWLQFRGYLTIYKGGKVLPHFPKKICH